ncbi:MAG: AAA family ATPase [Kangiellaceae bacterium]|nr:AAA family ATPase [Kangiellaceae bacterium]
MKLKPLNYQQLSANIGVADLPFTSFDELKPSSEFLGQDRAKSALSFGLKTNRLGYNLFVMGNTGTGRISMVKQHLETKAQIKNPPPDWVYVNNFEEVSEPWVIELPTGMGKKLVEDCRQFVSRILATVPAAFENPGYQRKKAAVEKAFNSKIESAIADVEKEANQNSFSLFQDASNISFSPVIDGEVVDEIKFESLSQAKRDSLNQAIDELEEKLSEALIEMPQWKRESYDAMQALKLTTTKRALEGFIDELEKSYLGLIGVQIYIKEVRKNLTTFLLEHFEYIESPDPKIESSLKDLLQQTFIPNLLIGNDSSTGAPVIYEPHPTYTNLFGRVEYWNENGSHTTNFQHIRSGAIHRANGGYLVLEVEKLLDDPFIWRQLTQVLQSQELKFESPHMEVQTALTIALSPHGVPLDLKVILVGNRDYYYQLQHHDPEFRELFRVLVDFDEEIERTPEYLLHMAQLVKSFSQEQKFKPITPEGFVELVRFSARTCGHQNRLNAQFGEIFELLGESDIISEQRDVSQIEAQDVVEAQYQREFRHSRIRNNMMEDVLEGQIIINTNGSMIGSVNGLTIWEIGSTEFGTPARITATVAPGHKGIVDIERESELGLSIHSKGVLILSGYLANLYAREFPLTLSANIVMEQSYGLIDGDSASLAELCALLSAITETPVNESFAITGSINQFGEVQAIGGVNEKVEGFFMLCEARGLSGEQGVIIPKANMPHLMLKPEVIEAVKAGMFKIYAVSEVSQAIELLCLPKGSNLDSFNQLITKKLKELHDICNDEDEEEGGEASGE